MQHHPGQLELELGNVIAFPCKKKGRHTRCPGLACGLLADTLAALRLALELMSDDQLADFEARRAARRAFSPASA